jgi:hypothetical protein
MCKSANGQMADQQMANQQINKWQIADPTRITQYASSRTAYG